MNEHNNVNIQAAKLAATAIDSDAEQALSGAMSNLREIINEDGCIEQGVTGFDAISAISDVEACLSEARTLILEAASVGMSANETESYDSQEGQLPVIELVIETAVEALRKAKMLGGAYEAEDRRFAAYNSICENLTNAIEAAGMLIGYERITIALDESE